jgi:hypothetical protein
MNIKAEVTDVPKEGEGPELITFAAIKAEHEVSCTSVCSFVSKLKNVSDMSFTAMANTGVCSLNLNR